MKEESEKQKIIEGYFVGDTVHLIKETEYSKKSGFKINSVAVVSKDDTKETLEGWKVIDYDKRIKEIVGKMNPENIKELYKNLTELSIKQKGKNNKK